MDNFLFIILIFLASVLVYADGATGNNVTSTKLPNGCIVMNSTEADPMLIHFAMPFPFVNCSDLNREVFNMSRFPSDTASMSFAHNKLRSFSVDDLARFTKLVKLDIRHNQLEIIEMSKVNPPTSVKSVRHLYLSANNLLKIPTDALRSFPKLNVLDLGGNKIAKIGDADFAHSQQINAISLGSNPLESISSKAWANLTKTIYAISLQFAGLEEVPGFVADMPRLMYLSLANNKISNVQANSFKRASGLRWLELAGNKIMRLDKRAFTGAEKLRLLDLSDNLLETLPPGVFDSLHDEEQVSVEMYENPIRCDCSLRWLKLWSDNLPFQDIRYKCLQPKRNHGKKAYDIKASDFSCLSDDEDWDANQECTQPQPPVSTPEPVPTKSTKDSICPKQCKCFDEKGVQYHPKLPSSSSSKSKKSRRLWWLGRIVFPHVDCSNAGLTAIPEDIRLDVKTLTMAENKLRTLKIADLKKYKSLETLDLEGCSLNKIVPDKDPRFRFENMTSISIHHNNLTSFGAEQLHCFPNLNLLRMYNNKINSMPAGMFQNNRRINRLYIGPNPIRNFDPKCLQGLDLYSLSLRNMSLKKIPDFPSKFQNLTYLELSDNLITTIPNNSFANMDLLFRLTLDNNLISNLEADAFRNCKKLRYLDLSENNIRTLPKGIFDDLDKDRIHIELWINRINCDCKMKWFKEWIERLEDTNPMTEIRFSCMTPLRIHGKVSDKLRPIDFTCDSTVKDYNDDHEVDDDFYVYEHGYCYSQGQLALAIVLTIVCMLLLILLAKCCSMRRKGGYARYKAQNDSNSQLDMDM
ncbi:uncharacterized protein LOC120340487 [Styela clava]